MVWEVYSFRHPAEGANNPSRRAFRELPLRHGKRTEQPGLTRTGIPLRVRAAWSPSSSAQRCAARLSQHRAPKDARLPAPPGCWCYPRLDGASCSTALQALVSGR
jgi:hypothetical protein